MIGIAALILASETAAASPPPRLPLAAFALPTSALPASAFALPDASAETALVTDTRKRHTRTGALIGVAVWAAVLGYTILEGGWDESGLVSWPSAALLATTTGTGAFIGSRIRSDAPPSAPALRLSYRWTF